MEEKKRKKVLVVEDDDMLRGLMISQIGAKYETCEAADGQLGMQEVKKSRPDLVVLDLMLPVVDGFGFLKLLRELEDKDLAKIPVIVVSNLSDNKSIERVQAYGIEAYFTKSDISLGTLVNRINRIFSTEPAQKPTPLLVG